MEDILRGCFWQKVNEETERGVRIYLTSANVYSCLQERPLSPLSTSAPTQTGVRDQSMARVANLYAYCERERPSEGLQAQQCTVRSWCLLFATCLQLALFARAGYHSCVSSLKTFVFARSVDA